MRVDAAKALALHARAEVGVVDANEEEVVPGSRGLGGGAADEDGAAVDVVDVRVPVILAVVDHSVTPLAGDGLAEAEDAAGRPQPLPVAVEVALGTHAADLRVRRGQVHQLRQHSRLDLDVVVQ